MCDGSGAHRGPVLEHIVRDKGVALAHVSGQIQESGLQPATGIFKIPGVSNRAGNIEHHARLAVMVSEIAVALISGGSALGGAIVGSSGAIVGSLVAQRAEKRRRRQESRDALIAQWRNDIRQLRNAEINHLARNEENKKQGQLEEPDPPEVDPWQHYEPLRRLRHELPHHAVSRVDELRRLRVQDRSGQIPDLLEQEVLHIETKKWKLPESPV